MNQICTVSEINHLLHQKLEDDVMLTSIFIRGEISNFTHHMKTGHFYFTLKDEKASIRAIMFQWNARHLRFLPQNGMNVILFGSVQLFERDGICQINCADMQPDGIGALYLAFEQLRQKLEREGLFDAAHKRPLPPLPRKIGVVTSKNGAALQDIRQIISRRYPVAELIVIPALVQGEGAPESICAGIAAAQMIGLDILIVGRGGGSLEDLWAFNDERVARAIYASEVPVISAVGHEVDVTIADYVADLRAPTPSAAAELAVPDKQTLISMLENTQKRMHKALENKLHIAAEQQNRVRLILEKNSPQNRIAAWKDTHHQLEKRLEQQGKYLTERPRAILRQKEAALEALSPLKVLLRGYAAVFSDGKVISSAEKLVSGERITIRFSDGQAEAIVESVTMERNTK